MKATCVALSVCIGAATMPMFCCCKVREGERGRAEYTIDAEYEEETGTLRGVSTVNYLYSGEETKKELTFQLYTAAYREGARYAPISPLNESAAYYDGKSYAKTSVLSVEGGEYEIGGEDENLLTVHLKEPLYGGDNVEVAVSFEVCLPKINHTFGASEYAVNLGNFFPILCAEYGDGGEPYVTEYASIGDPFVSESAHFTVSIVLPRAYVVAASGKESACEYLAEGGSVRAKRTYEGENMRDFAFVFSKELQYAEERVRTGNKEVLVRYYSVEKERAAAAVKIARETIEYYSAAYGEYPFDTYTIAETGLCTDGATYPGLTMTDAALSKKQLIYTIAHESAHQWWYAAVGSNQAEESWQDEGLAEYSAARFFDEHGEYGVKKEEAEKAAAAEYRAIFDVYSTVLGAADTRMSRPLREFSSEAEYRAIAYDKAFILFCTAEKTIGRSKIDAALRRYYKENLFSIATPEALVGAFEREGADVSGLFCAYLDGEAIV